MKSTLVVPGQAQNPPSLLGEIVSTPTQATFDPLAVLVVALGRLSPDCSRESWEAIGSIIFNLTGGWDVGFCLFKNWSRSGRKHRSLASIRAAWYGFAEAVCGDRGLDHLRPELRRVGHDLEEVLAEAMCYQMFLEGTLLSPWRTA